MSVRLVSLVEPIECIQYLQPDYGLRIAISFTVGQGHRVQGANLLPDETRQVMVSKKRSNVESQKHAESESVRADKSSLQITAAEFLHNRFRRRPGLGLGQLAYTPGQRFIVGN